MMGKWWISKTHSCFNQHGIEWGTNTDLVGFKDVWYSVDPRPDFFWGFPMASQLGKASVATAMYIPLLEESRNPARTFGRKSEAINYPVAINHHVFSRITRLHVFQSMHNVHRFAILDKCNWDRSHRENCNPASQNGRWDCSFSSSIGLQQVLLNAGGARSAEDLPSGRHWWHEPYRAMSMFLR